MSMNYPDLDWALKLHNNPDDIIKEIIQNESWALRINDLIKILRDRNISGIQDKFRDTAHLNQFRGRFAELELGFFLSEKGEKIKFLEGTNAPDLISEKDGMERVWEIYSTYDTLLIKILFEKIKNLLSPLELSLRVDLYLTGKALRYKPHNAAIFKQQEEIANLAIKALEAKVKDGSFFQPFESNDILFVIKKKEGKPDVFISALEGYPEGMAHLVDDEEENMWKEFYRINIERKKDQLLRNMIKAEENGTNMWKLNHQNIIGIVVKNINGNLDQFFIEVLFGRFWNGLQVGQELINNGLQTPWKDYIKRFCVHPQGIPLVETGLFFSPEYKDIHGVAFVFPNMSPHNYFFYANPFANAPNEKKDLENLLT